MTQAKLAVAKSIEAYNTKRPHMSIDFLTPAEAHSFEGELQKRWKNYRAKKFTTNSSNDFADEN